MILLVLLLACAWRIRVEATCDGEVRPHCECTSMSERFVDPCRSCSVDNRCHSAGDIAVRGYKCVGGHWLTSSNCNNPPNPTAAPTPVPPTPAPRFCDGEIRPCGECLDMREFGVVGCRSCSIDGRCHSSGDITINGRECPGGTWVSDKDQCRAPTGPVPTPKPTPKGHCDGETYRTCGDCTSLTETLGGQCYWCSRTGACQSYVDTLTVGCQAGKWIGKGSCPDPKATIPPTPAGHCDGETFRTCQECTQLSESFSGDCRWCSSSGACHSWRDVNTFHGCDNGDWITEGKCEARHTQKQMITTFAPTPVGQTKLNTHPGQVLFCTVDNSGREPCVAGNCLVAEVPCATGDEAGCVNGARLTQRCVDDNTCLNINTLPQYRNGKCCTIDDCNSVEFFKGEVDAMGNRAINPTSGGNAQQKTDADGNPVMAEPPFFQSTLGYIVIGISGCLFCCSCAFFIIFLIQGADQDEYVASNSMYHNNASNTMRSGNSNVSHATMRDNNSNVSHATMRSESPASQGAVAVPPYGGISEPGASYSTMALSESGGASNAIIMVPTTLDSNGGSYGLIPSQSAIQFGDETQELTKPKF